MTGNLIYLDTAIWVSYILEDNRIKKAEAQIERLNHGDTAIVSTLTIMEIVSVIRKRVIEGERHNGLNPEMKLIIQQKIALKLKKFGEKLRDLARQKKVMIVNPDTNLKDYLEEALKILHTHSGDINNTDFCSACRRDLPYMKYKFFGLQHFDIQHAINAKTFSANELVTFDKGFALLNTIPDFKSITPTVL